MRIRMTVDVAESIRRGKPSEATVEMELDGTWLAEWPDELRATLARKTAPNTRDGATNVNLRLSEATPEGLREAAEAAWADEMEEAEAQKATEDQAHEILESLDYETLAAAYDKKDGYLHGAIADACECDDYHVREAVGSEIMEHTDLRDRMQAVYVARERRENEEREAEEAERERLATMAMGAMVEWGREYGSDRLRGHLDEGIECMAIYRDERMAIELPDWVRTDDTGDEPRNVSSRALGLLATARNTLAGNLRASAKLRHVSEFSACPCADEDGDLDPICEDHDDDGEIRTQSWIVLADAPEWLGGTIRYGEAIEK